MQNAIAIVGMSCRFAGCPSPAALWNAVMARRNLLSVPGADAEIPYGQKNVFDRPYPTRLGQLGDPYACVPSSQDIAEHRCEGTRPAAVSLRSAVPLRRIVNASHHTFAFNGL